MCSLWRSMEESDDGDLEAVVRGYSRIINPYKWQAGAAGIEPGMSFGNCNSLVLPNLMLSSSSSAPAGPAGMDLQDLCSAFYGNSGSSAGLLRSTSSSSSLLFDSMEVQTPGVMGASNSIFVTDSHTTIASVKAKSEEKMVNNSVEMSPSGLEQRDIVAGSKPLKVEPKKECDGASSTSLSQGMDSGGSSQPAPKTQGSKRRKTQQKRIVCVPAAGGSNRPSGEGLPSDLWAWRKYGQKPIKGSPYPRGYYRCSSSKGCSARKQVERSRTDPTMLVITYTSDHNHPWPTHRNALAGSSRQNASSSSDKNAPAESRTSASKDENSEPTVIPENNINNNDNNNGGSLSKAGAGSNSSPEQAFADPENLSSIIQDDDELSNMLRSDEDFFAELGELPDIFPRHFEDGKSDEEEAGSSVVDPFNLFNWSSPPSTFVDTKSSSM